MKLDTLTNAKDPKQNPYQGQGVRVLDNRTVTAQNRLCDSPHYSPPDKNAPNGYYGDRHIIGRESTINGGVYLGGGAREAIVVDDKTDGGTLNKVFCELVMRKQRDGKPFNTGILKAVYDMAIECMVKGDDGLEEIIQKCYGDKKISISRLIEAKVGVCRHRAILAGYLLERLIKEGYITGEASVERHQVEGFEAHAWARYVNTKDKVYIVDPAYRYCGPIEEAPVDKWFYKGVRRPDLEMLDIDAVDEEALRDWIAYKNGHFPQPVQPDPPKPPDNNQQHVQLPAGNPKMHQVPGGKSLFIVGNRKLRIYTPTQYNYISIRRNDRTLHIEYTERGKTRIIYSGKFGYNDKLTLDVGRSDNYAIHSREPMTSENHCTIKIARAAIYVIDNNSLNGTVIEVLDELSEVYEEVRDMLIKVMT